jgi:hypothetical protein
MSASAVTYYIIKKNFQEKKFFIAMVDFILLTSYNVTGIMNERKTR